MRLHQDYGSHMRWMNTVVLLCLLMAGCASPTPVVVSPVNGLPEGTNGYPWWNDVVFYEIFVRSFYDSNADGMGDFNGLIEKLDYLNDGNPETTSDLGITGIWLMPINPSPSYHGYDVTDYYGINPDYGTMDDFRRFLEEAHKRGIRVIMDMVLNHTSSLHPWFLEAKNDPQSPKRDWYIWSDENPGYKGPWGQDVWYKTDNGFYYGIFSAQMPDLNYKNPDVIEEMSNVAQFWLQDVGVDGFRLDAAKHIVEEGQIQEDSRLNHTWWETFRTVYKTANPQAMTIGEVWLNSSSVAKYVEGDELDLAFEFDLAGSIISNVWYNSARGIRDSLQNVTQTYPPGKYGTFLTNHDIERMMTKLGGSEIKARMAAAILLTIPGVPFIYYGEEIGMTGTKPDENIRTPMQWSTENNAGFTTVTFPWRPANADYKEKNVTNQLADPGSLLAHYRTFIQLRNQHEALRIGDYIPIEADLNRILAYLRQSENETVLILMNLHKEPIGEYSLNLGSSTLSGSYQAVTMFSMGDFGENVKFTAPTINDQGGFENYSPVGVESSLPPYSIVMIQLQPEK
jgi:alpha-amylase